MAFWNIQGAGREKGKCVSEIMKGEGVCVVGVSETHVCGVDLSTEQFAWHAGRENVPCRAGALPAGGMGFLVAKDVRFVSTGVFERAHFGQLQTSAGPLHVCSVYAKQGADAASAERFYDVLQRELVERRRTGPVLIAGDFNARLGANGDSVVNAAGRRLERFVTDNDLVIVNLLPLCSGVFSRMQLVGSSVQQSTLDYVLVTREHAHAITGMQIQQEHLLSDHRPLIVTVNMRAECSSSAPVFRWCLSNATTADWAVYGKRLDAQLRHWLHQSHDPVRSSSQQCIDGLWSGFESAINCAAGAVFPWRAIDHDKCARSWWDSEASAMLHDRSVAKRRVARLRRSGACDSELESAQLALLKAKKRLRAGVRRKRDAWWREEECMLRRCVNPQAWWRRINELRAGRRGRVVPDLVLDHDGKVETDPVAVLRVWRRNMEALYCEEEIREEEMENEELQFYRQVVAQVAAAMRQHGSHELDSAITLGEVKVALSALKVGKAPGSDHIHAEFLVKAVDIVAPALHRLFQQVWRSECWPTPWGNGIITPIYKDGDARCPENYRAITLLSVVSKLFEMVLNNRITAWAEQLLKLVEEQGGFRCGRGTLDQQVTMNELVTMRQEEGLPTYLAYLDVRKAYDKVWRPGLLKALWDIGLRGKPWAMLQAMLARVERCVVVNSVQSDRFPCTAGVPQGAVLSPFLYAVYINGLAVELKNAGFGVDAFGRVVPLLLYADDIVLLARSPAELQRMLDVCAQYSKKWRFAFNTGKSNVVVCGSRPQVKQAKDTVWVLAGVALKRVREYKYLGVEFGVLGKRGRFKSVVARLHAKAQALARQLVWAGGFARGLSPRVLVRVWKSEVRPVLEFGCPLWSGGICDKVANQLEAVQSEFVRTVLGCRGASAAFVRSETGLESLQSRRDRLTVSYWHHVAGLDSSRLVAWVVQNRMRQVLSGGAPYSWCRSVLPVLARYDLVVPWLLDCGDGSPSLGDALRRVRDADRQNCVQQMAARDSLSALRRTADFGSHGFRACLDDRLLLDGSILRTRLRAGVLPLMAWTGRQRHWPKEMCVCPVCLTGAVEDVPHFLVGCPTFEPERVKLVQKIRALSSLPDVECCCVRQWLRMWESGDVLDRVGLLLSSPLASSRRVVSRTEQYIDRCILLYFIRLWKLRKQRCGGSSVLRAVAVYATSS